MADKVYPGGFRFFPKREQAPAFVKGELVIVVDEFIDFINDNTQYLSEYKGKRQIKLSILENDKGIYATVNTFKPTTEPKN